MPIVTEFTCSFPSMQYFTKDGTPIIFTLGKARITEPDHIKELLAEVAKGNPYIRGGKEVDTAKEDPISGLKARLRAELIAEMKANEQRATNPENRIGGNDEINAAFGALSSEGAQTTVAQKDASGAVRHVDLKQVKK